MRGYFSSISEEEYREEYLERKYAGRIDGGCVCCKFWNHANPPEQCGKCVAEYQKSDYKESGKYSQREKEVGVNNG